MSFPPGATVVRGRTARRDHVRGARRARRRSCGASVAWVPCGRVISSARWPCSTARPGARPSWPRRPSSTIRLFRRTLLKMLRGASRSWRSRSWIRSCGGCGTSRRARSTPSPSAVARSRRASSRPAPRRPPRRCRARGPRSRLPAIADVTPGWATFHASASCAMRDRRGAPRSAAVRSTIGRSWSSFSSRERPSSSARAPIRHRSARSREMLPVSRPNPSGPYVTTPVPCSPHQRIRSRSSSASIENSCWSEST